NGNQFANSGSYKNAIDSYTTAIQRNSGLAVAFFNRGLAYGMLNQKENAIADFSKALDLFKAQGESQKYQQTQDILQRLTQAAS
ncbi:MAG TPA: tetratricopeptide repeat protein, partial [Stenomitos sp.]